VKLVAIGRWPDTLRTFKVDGTTYDPTDGQIHDWPSLSMDENLKMIAKIAAVCNDASIAHSEHQYVATGMPTEAALKVWFVPVINFQLYIVIDSCTLL
jgi:hypothetical protein